MSSSWSDLPLDLLISIRNKLHNADLVSFRSVCSQWRSASPIPNPCPRYYVVSFDEKKNFIHLAWYLKSGITREHFISLPFSLSSPLCYFASSNGWLVFISYNTVTLYFFDPLSKRKFISPHLKPMLLRYYKKVKPTVHDYAYPSKVVVSSSIDAGIAVAGIVEVANRTNPSTPHRRFIFCRHADGDFERWSLLMEGSQSIIDIALAGDNRFYALGSDCEFYMLDARPPLVKLKKIKLWLPKHILEPSSENSPPVKCLHIKTYGMKKSGETDLKVYGYCRKSDRFISLKINVAKLHGYSNNIEVACDAKWSYGPKCSPYSGRYFTPLLKEHHSKFSVKI